MTVSDQLPSGLTYVSNTPGAGTYDSASGVWTVGPFRRAAMRRWPSPPQCNRDNRVQEGAGSVCRVSSSGQQPTGNPSSPCASSNRTR
ncbi:MAG: DUF11 domain-containing protein [Candidatus Thiothrix singaporensis]|uniref:DUF11 domain-containing protein n=1 Tax=Candidatus Thiothrix singaporensis TaxID=2799669 RepID=A0A7L6ARF9_9GAMM|nr:MAG: DUF11 domain-containing protein [Candidatus Thiothrix singaporensis]